MLIKKMNTYLQPSLRGGLCNKLFCLFSACDIAIKNKQSLIEPIFGLKKPILFSEIYDLNFFNENMRPYFNGDIIVKKENIPLNSDVVILDNLWEYSQSLLRTQRKSRTLKNNCMNIVVLNALRINPSFKNIQIFQIQ